jgi:ankyrin repeat protein
MSPSSSPLSSSLVSNVGVVFHSFCSCSCSSHSPSSSHLSALDAACYEGHLDVISTLLEEGVYAGLSTNDGSTCIHLLCKAMPKTTFPIPTEDPIIKQFGNIILSLIDAGANIKAASAKGVTPLTQACMVGSLEAVYLLLKYGANIQYRNG